MTKAFVALVESKTAITDLIGTAPTRLYPRFLPQGLTDFPASAYRLNSSIDTADFDGASTYDFASIDIWCYGKKSENGYADVNLLWETMRSELVDSFGTYAGIEIDHVWYIPSGIEDYIDDLELYSKQLELRIAYRR